MDREEFGGPESRKEIEDDFPTLRRTRYGIRSAKDPAYNCLAWALGDTRHFWEPSLLPVKGYYWPPGVPREENVLGWAKIFKLHGYEVASSYALEIGFQKVAIYEDSDGLASHVALQLPSGTWTSKLGTGHDIEHPDPDCLEGELYGRISRILKRPR